jgi:hypothetical protein
MAVSDGSDIEATFDLPGSYTLKIEDFPALDWEVLVNAS